MAIDSARLGTFDFDPQAGVLTWSDTCPRDVRRGAGRARFVRDDLPRRPPSRRPRARAGRRGRRHAPRRRRALQHRVPRRARRGRRTLDRGGGPGVLSTTQGRRAGSSARCWTSPGASAPSRPPNAAASSCRSSPSSPAGSTPRTTCPQRPGHPHRGGAPAHRRAGRRVTAGRRSVRPAPDGRARSRSVSAPAFRPGGHLPAGRAPVDEAALSAPLIGRTRAAAGRHPALQDGGPSFSPDDAALLAQLSQIAAGAIENARLYEELRGNDKRKDEFLAMLAHELRNPLAAILNAVALGSGDEATAEDAAWSMEVIQRQLQAAHPAHRRSPGRVAHHARQGAAAQGVRWMSRTCSAARSRPCAG